MGLDLFGHNDTLCELESPISYFKGIHLTNNSKRPRGSFNTDTCIKRPFNVKKLLEVEKFNSKLNDSNETSKKKEVDQIALTPLLNFHLFTTKDIYARANEKIHLHISHCLQAINHLNCKDRNLNNHCDSKICLIKSLFINLNLLTNYAFCLICQAINRSWISILPQQILICKEDNGRLSIIKKIQLEEITGILVDTDERIIYLLGPNAELILKESDKTDYFISTLLVATNRWKSKCSKNDEPFEIKRKRVYKAVTFLDVIKVPFYKIPSFNNFKRHFSYESPIEYFGNALVSFVDHFVPDFQAELMMSIGRNGKNFQPITLILSGRKLRICHLNGKDKERRFIEIEVKEIESIRRVEKPKCHWFLLLLKTGLLFYLAACSEALANDSFDRISYYIKGNHFHHEEEIAHVAISNNCIFIISNDTKEIIRHALIETISQLVKIESQLKLEFFADSIEEAEELATPEDLKWTLKFYSILEYQKCLQIITFK